MMLDELVALVPSFQNMSPREKCQLFAWYLHTCRDVEVVDNASIRRCFTELHAADPNVARELPRMADRKPPDLIRVRGGYKLVGSLRRAFDQKYGQHPSVVVVANLLAELPSKIPDLSERAFLSEAIDCYRVRAYRATIVMTWNLAFDHLLRWILKDTTRLAAFNDAIPKKYPKRIGCKIIGIEHFDEFKEAEVVEIIRTAGLLSKNVAEILRDKLKRRNIAAHPSQVVIVQSQADDMITDLINNVVLTLN